jgi:adenylylsulfate reductase subunit A
MDAGFLILGGGTAGCYAAIELAKRQAGSVLIAEKANISRSGCLAGGVNALNAYIGPGQEPADYARYASFDANGIARWDLLLSMSEGLNQAAKNLEGFGVPILKDGEGAYQMRGRRNVKINGEGIKPLLAKAALSHPSVRVLEQANVFALLVQNGEFCGALAVSSREPVLYALHAKACLVATGGASGVYRPNRGGMSQHKMWYPPFNTGAGLAMGILAGAEMTSLEMRFVALRCAGWAAPTGTLALGAGAAQANRLGEEYESRYPQTTEGRAFAAYSEEAAGRGPVALKTKGVPKQVEEDLIKAYLNMAPQQALMWLEGPGPSERDTPVEGTEPYIVGGHASCGYWVDAQRETTVRRLFAAGDAAGGCPQKYVTGACAEAAIAAEAMARISGGPQSISGAGGAQEARERLEEALSPGGPENCGALEEEMQSAMDEGAGGRSAGYQYSQASLSRAGERIEELSALSKSLKAKSMAGLVDILELQERLALSRSLIAHLKFRNETRWPGFGVNLDCPERSSGWECYVNSRLEGGKLRVFSRPLVREGETYAH